MSLSPEQSALRDRQGKGARYDAKAAPHDALLLARRGTAFFARKLNELTDEGLDGVALDGLSRRHGIAEISLQARGFAERFEALRKGTEPPPPYPPTGLADMIATAVSLPDRALRGLFHHSEVHLNVVWRDLTDADWNKSVRLPDGTFADMRATPLIRAKTIWKAALALNNGARTEHLPHEFQEE